MFSCDRDMCCAVLCSAVQRESRHGKVACGSQQLQVCVSVRLLSFEQNAGREVVGRLE
jgi:hypothetical protein